MRRAAVEPLTSHIAIGPEDVLRTRAVDRVRGPLGSGPENLWRRRAAAAERRAHLRPSSSDTATVRPDEGVPLTTVAVGLLAGAPAAGPEAALARLSGLDTGRGDKVCVRPSRASHMVPQFWTERSVRLTATTLATTPDRQPLPAPRSDVIPRRRTHRTTTGSTR